MRVRVLLMILLHGSALVSGAPCADHDAPIARAENLARRARVSASESQEGFLPELAIDGDRATRWSGIPGHNSGVWYELAWDAEVAVASLVLFQYDRYVEELDLAAWNAAT